MARVTEYGTAGGSNPFENDQNSHSDNTHVIAADQQGPVQVPSDDFIADADIVRDGQDLILEAPDGSTIVIEGYFNADPAPMITAPDGSALTPKMVLNFVHDAGDLQYARADSVVDESPVGHVLEVNGQATVTRADGSSQPLMIGMKIYEGDIVETDGNGAVNIQFIDDSTFAVSENARLAIDEYVFDPQTDSGSTNFSVLRGLFVFTSGLIGRDDPDDVQIDTPVGSIGIRGTTIMGNVDTGEITVVEGAIVMRNFDGNEMTLDEQFETGRFVPSTGEIVLVGTLSSGDMAQNYDSMSGVMPSLFSGFADTTTDGQQQPTNDPALVADAGATQDAPQDGETQTASADTTQQTTIDDATNASGDGTTQVAAADGTTDPTAADGTTTTADAGATTDGSTSDAAAGTTTDGTTQVASADTTQQTTTSTAPDGSTTITDPTTTTVASADGTTTTADTTAGDTTAGDTTTTTDTTDPFVVAGSTGFADATGTSTSTSGDPLPGSTSTTTTTTTSTTSSSTTTTTSSGTTSTTTTATNPPPPPPLDIAINHLAVEDSIATGQLIAVVGTTYDFPDVKFVLLDDLGGQIALVDNPTGNKAEIRLVSGSLTAGTPLDIAVRAILPDGRATSEHFNVDVVNTNTTPTITNDLATFAVDENSTGGTLVGQVLATDPDAGQTLSYYITGGDPLNQFIIDSSGNIRVNGSIDFETTSTYNLNIRVQDNGMGALYDLGSYTVNINNLNETPVLNAPAGNYTIAENAATSAIVVSAGDIAALASDPDGDTLTYNITAGNASGAFAINSTTGEITVSGGGLLDYETTQQYTLTVEAFDGSYSAVQNFTIDITNVDDEATTIDVGATLSAAVGIGTTTTLTTGMLSASDLDTADTGITYNITTVPANGHIALASAAGTAITSFTQDDLVNGRVVYVHDGSATSVDSFAFNVGDGVNGTDVGSFSISINDVTAPTLQGSGTEISGLSDLANLTTDLFMHFDEAIQAGTGNIYVRETGTSTIIATIDVTNTGLVTFNGSEMKIVIPSDLQYETSYYVEVDAGAVTDIAGNAFGGFTGTTTFNFGTGRQTFLTTVGGLGSDGAHGTLELRDPSTNKSDGYIMLGEVTSGGQQDIMITKLDNHGFVEDVSVLGGADTETFAGVAHNAAGVFIAATTNDTTHTHGLDDFMLTSVDLNGNVLWSNTYGTTANNLAADVAASTTNNDVFIAGTTQATNQMMTVTSVNGADGTMNWSVDLAESGLDVSADAVLAMNNAKYGNDVLVGGDHAGNGGDMVIMRLDDATNGAKVWAYTIDVGNSADELEAMTEMSDGSLVLAGSTYFTDGVGGDGLLVKLSTDAGGNTPSIDWAVSVGAGSSFDSITDVIQLADGNIAVAGRYGSSSDQAFVAVFNQADGTMVWGSLLSNSAGLTGAASIEETVDGMLLISGQTSAGVNGSNDAFALQMTLGGGIENKVGTLITNGSLGDNWSITALSPGIVSPLVAGTDITITSDAAISSAGAGTSVTNWAGLTVDSADDVNHADDVFGTTNVDFQLYDTVAANNATLNAMGQDGIISGFDGNDTIYTDGNDVINGGTGDDIINLDASGTYAAGTTLYDKDFGYVDGGAGNDIFKLDSDHNIDLSMMKDGFSIGLTNIEIIDLMDTNSYAQQLTLSYDAIIAMTDTNNALVINGDTTAGNDSVIANLAAAGTVGVDAAGGTMGAGYTDYSVTGASGTIHLYVADTVDQTGITTA